MVLVALLSPACTPDTVFTAEDRSDREPDWTDLPPPPDPFDLGGAIADARLVSEMAYDYLGCDLDSAGDVNGDGYGDVVVGAYSRREAGYRAGAAYLLLGPLHGEVEVADAHARYTGEGENNIAGYDVAGAGDIDADGLDEVLVGAPVWGGIDEHGGRAYILGSDHAGDVDLGSHGLLLDGEHEHGHAGKGISPGGDVDGDGEGDLLVGDSADPGGGEMAGAAYVLMGPVVESRNLADADAKFIGELEGDVAGSALASAGDVDDDGYGDFIVGAPRSHTEEYRPGRAYVIRGPVSGTHGLGSADTILEGESPADWCGYAVAGGSDLDGDGLPDVLVGAKTGNPDGIEGGGIVYVVISPPLGTLALADADVRIVGGEDMDAQVGTSVAMAGDVDGDGVPDILIGGWRAGWLLTGPLDADIDLTEAGVRLALQDYWASDVTVAAGGDVDGDGIDDFWFGAMFDPTDHEMGGGAYLFYGGDRFR